MVYDTWGELAVRIIIAIAGVFLITWRAAGVPLEHRPDGVSCPAEPRRAAPLLRAAFSLSLSLYH